MQDLVATGVQISRDLLDTNDAFILDDGYEVMVWIGKGASRAERKNVRAKGWRWLSGSAVVLFWDKG